MAYLSITPSTVVKAGIVIAISGCLYASSVASSVECQSVRDTVEWPKITLSESDAGKREYYDASIGDQRFLIPVDLVRSRIRDREYVELMVKWPEMTSAWAASNRDADGYDLLYIRLEPNSDGRYEDGIKRLERTRASGNLAGPFDATESSELLEYPPRSGNVVWYFKSRNRVVTTPMGNPIVLDCRNRTSHEEQRNLVCGVELVIDGLRFKALFHERYLSEWKAVFMSAMDLYDSMKQSCN